MSSREWPKKDAAGGEDKEEKEEEVKAAPRKKKVTLKEGHEERPVTPTPAPEDEEAEEEEEEEATPTKEDEEAVEEELTAMGQKVEEIKGDGEASVSQAQPQEVAVPASGEVDIIEESSMSPSDRRILYVVMAVITALLTSLVFTYAYSTIYTPGPATIFEDMTDTDIVQMTEKLQKENSLMVDEMTNLQEINLDPIKIKGKDGAKSRQLREEIHKLISENEELRLAVGRLWLTEQPQATPLHRTAFSDALAENHKLRSDTEKLRHLGADLQDLQSSVSSLKEQNNDLRVAYADFKYQKVPIPKELDIVSRETETIAKQVMDASRKRKPPPNLPNAKNYVAYMGQILSTMSSLHEFGEASAFGKIDIASDVFTDLVPKPNSVPPTVEQKIRQGRAKFQELKTSLAAKWGQLKSLSEPENIRAVGRDTLAKMNRVLVNVVGKLKDIGQSDLLRRGKTPVEKTASTLADKLTVLDEHFDNTWNDLEAEVNMEAVDEELAQEMIEDDGSEEVAPDDDDEEEGQDEPKLPVAAAADDAASAAAGDTAPVAAASKAQKTKEKDLPKKKEVNRSRKDDNQNGKVSNPSKKATREDKKRSDKTGDGGRKDDKKEANVDKSKKTTEKKSDSKDSKQVQQDNNGNGKRGKKLPKKADRDSVKGENNNDEMDKDIKSSKSKTASKSGKDEGGEDGKEGGRYFKGHYNKDKTGGQKKKKDKKDGTAEKRKHFKRADSDDDDDDKSSKGKGDKKSGLNRHWEKPVKQNFFRDSLGSRRQFIRRKGKEGGKRQSFTRQNGKWKAQRDDDDGGNSVKNSPIKKGSRVSSKANRTRSGSKGKNSTLRRGKNQTSGKISKKIESSKKGKVTAKSPSKITKTWDEKRSEARSQKRLNEKKAEWQFERARDRWAKRDSATKSEWQFDRGSLRKNLRDAKRLLKQKRSEKKKLKREQRKQKEDWRTYKRSIHVDEDDKDADDDDYDYYGKDSRFVKRKTYQSSGKKGNLRNKRDR